MRKKLISTSAKGLAADSFPMQLYQKAKKFGTWNPADIDFSKDQEDWHSLSEGQREWAIKLLAQFQGGEEAVTLDLLPLLMVTAREGRLEEEIYLTTFLYDEAKHTEFFRLVLNAVGEHGDLSHHHSEAYKKIFYELLPEVMEKLWHDQSPEAIADASCVYNMFAEGVLAETGYKAFHDGLQTIGKMPGLLKGIEHLKRDEARHISYGTYLLQRLISEHPHLYPLILKRLTELAPIAAELNAEGMVLRQKDSGKQAAAIQDIQQFSAKQLRVRMEILGRARGRTVEEIFRGDGGE
ncbi:R2-like ligand-binding oxidase [Metabacillus sp. GX 13764]|nr:R2-like ligand-binding oxidase [Metabacillus kandeliae]